jgi:hypothetical protein
MCIGKQFIMAGKHTGKYKVLKWVGAVLGVIVLLAVGAALYLSAKWKPLVSDKIKEAVYNGSDKLYRLDFKDIHLNLITGSATFDSVSLMPDTAVFRQLKLTRQAPTHLFQVKLAKLRLRHIGIMTAYFQKRIDMTDIILDKPSINMIYNKVPKRPDTVKDERTLYEQISKTLKSIHIKGIKIVDADFDYINGADWQVLNRVKHLNVVVKDILIDSLSGSDTSRLYYTKDIGFSLIGYKSVTKDKMYTLKADTLSGSASDKTITIKGLKMIPMYPDLTFSRKYKTQKDRYDLSFNTIKLRGVDFVRLNQEGSIHAGSATLGPAKVGIFMNRELPPPSFNKGRNYPHIALRRLSLPLLIDTLKISNIDVAYTEYNPITKKRGTVYLDNLKGRVLNVTNDSAGLAKNNHAKAQLSTRIMKAVNLSVNIDFNLTAANGAFSYNGTVGPMDMRDLNPLSEALGLVKIESGKVQKADFNINADLNGSRGKMHFYYTDLKVAMLKEGEAGEKPKKQGLLSFLANNVLIKDANPTKDQPVRVADINFQRTPAASFFNLLWKGVFIGIRETVGIGIVPVKSPEEAHVKIVDKKVEKTSEQKAQERKEKRQERKEKREKRKAEKENN